MHIETEFEFGERLKVRETEGGKVLARKDGGTTLPGEPLIQLVGDNLLPHLRKVFVTPELDRMSTYFRFIATPDSSHIFPLHFQPTRGRQVLPNERHSLHLVWHNNLIFIKPIPPYLLHPAFWEWIAEASPDVHRAAAGFMRSYSHLVRSELDYRLATDDTAPLMPHSAGMQKTTADFEKFARFITQFARLPDEQVSDRYSYGELRLSRLNWLVRLMCINLTYFHVGGQWGPVFMSLLAPLVAAFAVLSVFLAAMQVGLAVEAFSGEEASQVYIAVCKWFSVVVLAVTAVLSLGFLAVVCGVLVNEQIFGFRKHRDRRKKRQSGVVYP